jgi:ribonuclease HII
MPDLSFELPHLSQGRIVAGVDEAGRGPLAGPVVAAAVILNPSALPHGINDSKQLSRSKRDALYEEILRTAHVGVGLVEAHVIDEINILQATLRAMREAVLALPCTPSYLLIDGNRLPTGLPCPAEAVVKGDSRSLSIAAASIIAKVTRDRIMEELDAHYPEYGFARHAGYGTKAHLEALERHGITPEHRKSFAPVRVLAD